MVIIKPIEEEEQASSSNSECYHYHVFLSFRGADTRHAFTDYLYRELLRRGYFVFRDDEELSSGQNIRSELQKAIQESKISIIVFSKDYASSKWCLDELVTIMKRREHGHHVLPVFYHVDPGDVRNQRGGFAESFVRHEEVFSQEVGRVEGWRAALREVGALKGVTVTKHRFEIEFIQEIVEKVRDKVRLTVRSVAPQLVGREEDIDSINSWLRNGSDEVGIATIWGMGGIGKTTIAREVYNLNLHRFEEHCFLEDVSKTKKHRLVCLQTKLLKALGYAAAADSIPNVADGRDKIRHMVRDKRVLLVLDDVDDLHQFDALIGEKNWFCSGSKIIITTKLKCIPKAHERDKVFKIMKLDDEQSLELLSWHAFGQDHPLHGYYKCSTDLVHYCNGLPLALQVLGSSLSGTSTEVWESELQKLKANPKPEIKNVLEISYQSLPDSVSKKLFLDVACFCIGIDMRYAVRIFDGCGVPTVADLRNLEDRCLITIVDNKLTMHQLVEDMAKDLVRQESIEYPGKRSRIWDNEDAVTVLTQNTGTESIRGFRLNHLPSGSTSCTEFHGGSVRKRRRLSLSFWTPVNNSPMLQCSTMAFAKMQNLKFLNLGNVELNGSCNHIPKGLVWLRWQGSLWSCIPNNLSLEKLAVLEMPSSNLRYVWKGLKPLLHLKVLDLRQSRELTTTPNFEGVPGLEILVLEDCTNLLEVHPSIGVLKKFKSLNLKNCHSLRLKLPVLKSLEELDISGCPNPGKLLEVLLKFESLEVLNADGITMKDFKQDKLRWWKSTLWLRQLLPRRYEQSTSFCFDFLPRSLTSLSLVDCGLSDDIFPTDFTFLSLLTYLNLGGNPITRLPESIKQLSKLHEVELSRCNKLQSVHSLSVSVKQLNVRRCISLEKIEVGLEIWAGGCEKLVEISAVFKRQPVGNIDRDVQKHLGLCNLESLGNAPLWLCNFKTGLKGWDTIQVSREYGMHSVFLPGPQIPDCFHHRVEGNSILFDLSPIDGQELIGFSLFFKYCLDVRDSVVSPFPDFFFDTTITNMTSRQECRYYMKGPRVVGVLGPGLYEDMLSLSYWVLEEIGFLEAGDRGKVSLDVSDFDVKECGVRLIYREKEAATQDKAATAHLSLVPHSINT